MEENRTPTPETPEQSAPEAAPVPAEQPAPAESTSPKKKLSLKSIIVMAAAAAAVIAVVICLLCRGSASSVAKRFVKAYFGDSKTAMALTAYDWKQYEMYGYDDEEEYFEDISYYFDEEIESWNDCFKAVDDFQEENLEDTYGDYKISVEVTKTKDISVKKMLENNSSLLNTLESRGVFDRDSIKDAKVVTVKAKIKGEDGTERDTFNVYLVKAGNGWKVLDYEEVN